MIETSGALTIMIVDDDELIRRVVTIYFGNRGHHVINAVNGQDCLDKMQVSKPDAVLLDVTMPGIDGWEVCRCIRETSDVPIIILTARAQESDREMGAAVGASAFVTKPVSLKELEARVRSLVMPRVSSNDAGGIGAAV
jgi:two-component system, OmpR family, response regulator